MNWRLLMLALFVGSSRCSSTKGRPRSEHYDVSESILAGYNRGLIPKMTMNESIKVFFSIELYQLIEVNEPQQYLMLNAWIVERWVDNLLGWDPAEFENITELMLPHDVIWLPDTTLYNSLVMSDEDTRRLLHAKLTTRGKDKGALVELLYPTIYKLSCLLNLRFFPFDVQTCRLTFGSWTFDNTLIDYFAHNPSKAIGTTNCIENEGWNVLSTSVRRLVNKYECCPNNYTLLEFNIVIQRKPLYYIINLITPTSIITLISIVGFFTSSSINEPREEKITLGITTLLSMSILIFMVSDKMPSTSSFIPLIGWFYTSMICLISLSTLCSSIVIYIQKQGILGKAPAQPTMKFARMVAAFVRMEMPLVMKQAYARKARKFKLKKDYIKQEEKLRRQECRKQSLWSRVYRLARDQAAIKKVSRTSSIVNCSQSVGQKFNGISPEKLEEAGQHLPVKKCFTLSSEVTCFGDDSRVALASDDEVDLSLTENEMLRPEPKVLRKASTCASFDSVLRDHTSPNILAAEVAVSPRQERNLAQLEWDWLAALLERIFLILFIIIFILTAIGINLIGFFYWWIVADKVLV